MSFNSIQFNLFIFNSTLKIHSKSRLEEANSLEVSRSPIHPKNDVAIATPPKSPQPTQIAPSSPEWPAQSDEDIDRLVAMHRNRNSLSSLGVSISTLYRRSHTKIAQFMENSFHTKSLSNHLTNKSIDSRKFSIYHWAPIVTFRFDGKRLFGSWRWSLWYGCCERAN